MPQKITPDLIPHDEFHTGCWLLPVKRPGWYYFLHRKSEHAVRNKRFLQSVDKPLRELVRWLHRRGIKTTPSCTGHAFSRSELEQVYHDLEQDAEDIRYRWLELKDVETGRILRYSDPGYRLPWDCGEFLEKISDYQKKGVLGLRLEGKHKPLHVLHRLRKFLRRQVGHGIRVRIKDSIVLILTKGDSYPAILNTWELVSRGLQKVLP